MRFWLLFIALVTFSPAWAQTVIPYNGTYTQKYYYLDTNQYLREHHFAEVADTLAKMEKKAEDLNDDEFADKLRLCGWVKLLKENKINKDSIESALISLDSDAKQNEHPFLEADILQTLGDVQFENRKPTAGMENHIASYEIFKNFSGEEFPPKQIFLYELGSSFYRYEDYESAIKYLQDARRAKKLNNIDIYCSIFNTIGMSYRQMSNYDSAIVYYLETYNIASSLNNKAWMGIAEGNIGITYFLQKKYNEAIPLLERDIESSMATNNVRNAVGTMAVLATIYNDRGQHAAALKLLNKGLSIAEPRSFWPNYALAEALFTQLYKAYGATGNYRLAYLYADSALAAKDSVANQHNSLALAKAHEQFHYIESEKLRGQIKMGLADNKRKQLIVMFTFVGIMVLLGVVIFIARERRRSETLLLNILPEKIAERLKRKEHPIADYFDNASIIFIDMAGFTIFSDGRDPKEVVNLLNHIFTEFDALAEKYGLEKIKTIGDCYMAVSGLPEQRPDHAEAATKMALAVKSTMKDLRASDGTPVVFRIGLDCGPVVAGVIGRRKFIYDLWGDTVNTASRMESTGLAGEIHCSDRFKKKVEDKHKFVQRGETEIKGKGMMETWLIIE